MFQVVKEIISSVSIDPSSGSEAGSEKEHSEDELASSFESTMNISGSKADTVKKLFESQSKTFPKRLPDGNVDEYMNKTLESIVKRFYEHKNFEEYTKVRDYNFGESKLELLSKFRGKSNLKEFIVNGIIDVPMENLLNLVMEMSNRTRWDETYMEHQMLSYDEPTKTDFIFSVSKYPFPLTKRTYLVSRTCYSYGKDCLVVLSATTTKVKLPKKFKWATQVDEFESMLVVMNCEPEEVDGVKKVNKSYMLATYFENPKVLLPNSYLNFLIGQLVPGILNKMIIASKKMSYEESLEYVKSMNLIPIPI